MRQPFLHPTEDTALLSIGSFGNVPGSFLNRVSVPAQHPRGGRIERTVAWLIASGDYTCTSWRRRSRRWRPLRISSRFLAAFMHFGSRVNIDHLCAGEIIAAPR